MKNKEATYENVRLGKLVHGGQCLAEAPNGKKLFVWGGLPSELVTVKTTKKKRSYMEAIVTEVHEASKKRIDAKEPLSYLSTSPWQIMTYKSENEAKQAILKETFDREGLADIKWDEFTSSEHQYGYRNKMEFGFWGDGDGIHLAHFVRGTSGKQIVTGSLLATPAINDCLDEFVESLNVFATDKGLRAGDLKTVSFRSSEGGEVVAALFIKKDVDCSTFMLPKSLKGIVFYKSDPKSPASVLTKKLYSFGDIKLTDTVMGKNITYDVLSFFQVNLPIFEVTLKKIDELCKGARIADFYSGVGTIGIPIKGTEILVESDVKNIEMAKLNVLGTKIEVVEATSQNALEFIDSKRTLIIDPPRAGLHRSVVERILEVKPPKIVYLSCNPSTQARDVALLAESYKVKEAKGYNFFPRTPHIESLIVLEKK